MRALRFEERAYRLLFGCYERDSWHYWAISPSRDMLAIRLGWGPDDLIDNLRIAMLMEAVRFGPQRYCIVFNSALDFYSKLKLILYSLPQEKMFLYPAGTMLGGPFLHAPWLSRAQALQAQPSITREEYAANFERQ